MKVRFTEYVTFVDYQINLFFMQERADLFSVIVRAKGERPVHFHVQKEGEKNWATSSKNIPEWAKLIESYLQGILERRLEMMKQPNFRDDVGDHSQKIVNR